MSAAGPFDADVVPLAITRADGEWGCVGALTDGGVWLRPEPLRADDLERADSVFTYDRRVILRLWPSSAADARPEDRDLRPGEQPRQGSPVDGIERMSLIARHLDRDAASGFDGDRSLAIIRAELQRLYVKRSTGGRTFVRAAFTDAAGQDYDWIVPDIAVVRCVRPRENEAEESARAAALTARLAGRATFFTIGLTKPNDRMPGRFRGCHPLVVGIHTQPDYRVEGGQP